MNKGNKLRTLNFLAALAAVLMMLTGADRSHAANDLLELEAEQSQRASKYLLLDITSAGDRLVAVGARGHIVYSDDDGKSWTQAESVPVMVNLTAVSFPTPELGWAVGHDGVVLNTTDAGVTWVKQIDGNDVAGLIYEELKQVLAQRQAEYDAADEATQNEMAFALENLGYSVEDAQYALEEGPWKPFLDVFFLSETEGFIVGAYGMILRTVDSGKSWQPLVGNVDNPETLHLNAIGKTASGMFMVGEMGVMFRSHDGGINWESVESPYGGSFFGVVTDPASDTVVALGLRGNAYVSKDFGTSWKQIDNPAKSAINSGILLDDGGLIVATAGVFKANGLDSGLAPMQIKPSIFSSMELARDGQLVVVGLRGAERMSPEN